MKNIYKKNLIIMFGVALTLLITMGLLNYFIDAGNQFFRAKFFENNLSQNLIRNNVLVCANYNDRDLKKLLIRQLPFVPDTMVLGSSRTMLLTKHLFDTKKYFNGSVTSANLEDDIALFYLAQKNGWKLKTILLGLDPWIISQKKNKNLWKSSLLLPFAQARRVYFNQPESIYLDAISGFYEKYIQLISPSYFRETVKNIKLLGSVPHSSAIAVNPTQEIIDNLPFCFLHLPDGTRLSSIEDESVSSQRADYAGAVAVRDFTGDVLKLDKPSMRMFEHFVQYLKAQKIDVIFYLPPYEPVLYTEVGKNYPHSIIVQTEKYFRWVANRYHIKVVGTYNPANLHLTAADFIDEIHLKKQGIDKFFAKGLKSADKNKQS